MSNTEHSGAAHRSFRCTFGPVREVDLVWPPTDEDIDAFSIVHLDGSDAARPMRLDSSSAEPAPREAATAAAATAETASSESAAAAPPPAEPVATPPVRLQPRRIKPTFGDCRSAAPRIRPLVVPMEPPPLPEPEHAALPPAGAPLSVAPPAPVSSVPVPSAIAAPEEAEIPPLPSLLSASAGRPVDAETAGAGRSAWLAVFFAAACALVTFAEYRGLATLGEDASEAPPVPPQVSVADVPPPVARAVPRPAAPQPSVVQDAAAPPPERVVAAPAAKLASAPVRPIPEPARKPSAEPSRPVPAPTSKLAAAPAPAPQPRLAVVAPKREVEHAAPSTPRVTVDVIDRGPEPATAIARAAATPPKPAPTPAPAAVVARPEPLASALPPAPVAAVVAETANDEADIRSTLTRFRTAYSQLNASAARDVWPSVDARALERAFQSLKSQDLRFDSCKMTVTGARAQAACKGRAVYVPRIGDQSPRFTSREWNFELRKADERWTISSARSL
jgi:hypothetical protein